MFEAVVVLQNQYFYVDRRTTSLVQSIQAGNLTSSYYHDQQFHLQSSHYFLTLDFKRLPGDF